jgi:hypothetical protein
MINDYDEGRALAERSPAGVVVSLAELADPLVVIERRAGLRGAERMPLKPLTPPTRWWQHPAIGSDIDRLTISSSPALGCRRASR